MLCCMSTPSATTVNPSEVMALLAGWGRDLGFSGLAVSRVQIADDDRRMREWVAAGLHGQMDYLARNQDLRADPAQLLPGTLSVICVRLPYWPRAIAARDVLQDRSAAYISRYALGRDYHKSLRGRLRELARRLESRIGPFGYRAFADSAPAMEKPLARDASLGWMGKHSLLIDGASGSYFFLGELYTDLALPPSATNPIPDACGACQACINACPTGAILPGRKIDARRCISYLTIEHRGSIPVALRPAIGNRIFGCDDCQLVCPWNRDAQTTADPDFAVRHQLDGSDLLALFSWSETEFLAKTQGMALRRAGYVGFLRNLAVAIGNGPATPQAIAALTQRAADSDPVVSEHVQWALQQLHARLNLLPKGENDALAGATSAANSQTTKP